MKPGQERQIRLNNDLCTAAAVGDLEKARQLLDAGASVNHDGPSEATPFIAAAKHGHPELFPLLLSRGARANSEQHDGANALVAACENGRENSVRALLGIKPLGEWEKDEHTKGSLQRALRNTANRATESHEKTLRALLDGFESQGLLGDSKEKNRAAFCDARGDTPLMLAARAGSANGVRLLADFFDASDKNNRGEDALSVAMQNSRAPNETVLEVLRVLVELGVSQKNADNQGRTAIMEAAFNGRAECVKILLNGSDAKMSDNEGDTALMCAVIDETQATNPDFLECVRALLPVSTPSAKNNKGRTALDIALLVQSRKNQNDVQQNDLDAIALLATANEASKTQTLGRPTAFESAMACQSWAAANAMATRASDEAMERVFLAFAETVGPAMKARAEALFMKAGMNAALARQPLTAPSLAQALTQAELKEPKGEKPPVLAKRGPAARL